MNSQPLQTPTDQNTANILVLLRQDADTEQGVPEESLDEKCQVLQVRAARRGFVQLLVVVFTLDSQAVSCRVRAH